MRARLPGPAVDVELGAAYARDTKEGTDGPGGWPAASRPDMAAAPPGQRDRSATLGDLGEFTATVGRADLYGLAAAGEPGARHAAQISAAEFRTAMALRSQTIRDSAADIVRRVRPAVGHKA